MDNFMQIISFCKFYRFKLSIFIIIGVEQVQNFFIKEITMIKIIKLGIICAIPYFSFAMVQESAPSEGFFRTPIIEEYAPGAAKPIPKGTLKGVRLWEEYIPSHVVFEKMSPDLLRLMAVAPAETIEEAVSNSIKILDSSPQMRGFLGNPAFNEELIKILADKFYGNHSIESMIQAANLLGTDGAKAFLMNQTDFLFQALQRSDDPKYVSLAKILIENDVPVNIRNARGYTPLMVLLMTNLPNIELANLLLNKGAEIKVEGFIGNLQMDGLIQRAEGRMNTAKQMGNISKRTWDNFQAFKNKIMAAYGY